MSETEIEKDEGAGQGNKNTFIPGKPYSKLKRDLTDDDLTNPAVQKLLLNEIDKLEISCAKLEHFQSDFYLVDKEKAILEEKLKVNKSGEIIYSFCLAVGSGMLGLASLPQLLKLWWVFIVMGSLLIIGGILSKYIKWN